MPRVTSGIDLKIDESRAVIDQFRLMYFHALPQAEQEAAIRRLAAAGQGEHTIAHATGLSVEQIRRVLAEAHHV